MVKDEVMTLRNLSWRAAWPVAEDFPGPFCGREGGVSPKAKLKWTPSTGGVRKRIEKPKSIHGRWNKVAIRL